MGRIEADIALESWVFRFRPSSGQEPYFSLIFTKAATIREGGQKQIKVK